MNVASIGQYLGGDGLGDERVVGVGHIWEGVGVMLEGRQRLGLNLIVWGVYGRTTG